MEILITGGFGRVGIPILKEAYNKGHVVTVYEFPSNSNKSLAHKLKKYYDTVVWGDVRDIELLANTVRGKDVVLHLAAIVPPDSEGNYRKTHEVNVKGLENIINSIIISRKDIKLIYYSSFAVNGYTQKKKPPIGVDEPYLGTNNYSITKIKCEQLLDISKVDWCIFRLGFVMGNEKKYELKMLKVLFDIPLDYRMESVVDRDVAFASITAAEMFFINSRLSRKKLYIAGGKKNGHQHICRDFVNTLFKSQGIKAPGDKFFSENKTYSDWYDTKESQEILKYQNTSFDDFINSTKLKMKPTILSRFMSKVFEITLENKLDNLGK